jgi:hypothetical protein
MQFSGLITTNTIASPCCSVGRLMCVTKRGEGGEGGRGSAATHGRRRRTYAIYSRISHSLKMTAYMENCVLQISTSFSIRQRVNMYIADEDAVSRYVCSRHRPSSLISCNLEHQQQPQRSFSFEYVIEIVCAVERRLKPLPIAAVFCAIDSHVPYADKSPAKPLWELRTKKPSYGFVLSFFLSPHIYLD